MFYDDFLNWCRARDTTPAQAAKELGVLEATVRSWNMRLPGKAALARIADHFGLEMQTVCDAAREHLLQRPGYRPEIFTGEGCDRTGRVLTRVTTEFFPELPMPWAMRTVCVEHLQTDAERAAYKARLIARAAPEAVPILKHIYGDPA